MQSLTAMFTKKTVTLLPLLAATLSLASCDDFRGVPSDKPHFGWVQLWSRATSDLTKPSPSW